MSKAEPLYRLQLLDSDLDQARKQLQEVEAALSSNPAVTHAQAELAAVQKIQHKAAAELKSLELEAQSLDAKIKDDEDRLYAGNIRVPKEMVDLQREVQSLKQHRKDLDETLLGLMLDFEEKTADLNRCQAALAEARGHWEGDSVALRQQRDALKDRISADMERREAVCVAIPRADMAVYTNLRAKKPTGIAVAMVKGGACSQCGEEASSVLLQQVRNGTSLAMCPTCGRILHAA
jgi:uncharacterized protein